MKNIYNSPPIFRLHSRSCRRLRGHINSRDFSALLIFVVCLNFQWSSYSHPRVCAFSLLCLLPWPTPLVSQRVWPLAFAYGVQRVRKRVLLLLGLVEVRPHLLFCVRLNLSSRERLLEPFLSFPFQLLNFGLWVRTGPF